MEVTAVSSDLLRDQPRTGQSSQYPWQDSLSLLLNCFPDIFSEQAQSLGRLPPTVQQTKIDGRQVSTSSFLNQVSRIRDEKIDQIETVERKIVAAQKLASETFNNLENDSGRILSPFLLLDPQNLNTIPNYGVFATRSMGDFLDWSDLKCSNLISATNGTCKPNIPSPSQSLYEQRYLKSAEPSRLDNDEPKKRYAKRSRRLRWDRVQKPIAMHRTKTDKPSAVFQFNPKALRFRNYIPGGVYEALFEVVNTSKTKSFCQLGPSLSAQLNVFSLSSTSYMASGMAVRYVAVFHPDSYQSMTDRIEILSPDGSSSILCVQARNELPKLMYPSVVDLGKCLPGTTMKAIVTIENKGGFGLFYVMRRSEYDAFTESEYKLKEDRLYRLTHYNHYIFGRYEIRPALFELEENEMVDLNFSLPIPYGAPENFSVDLVMVGHLGQVYGFLMKAQVSSTILQMEHQTPKMKVVDDDQFCHVDLSASHMLCFPPTFLDMFVELKFALRNTSDFDLVYYWRNVVPRISTKLDALKDANADDWTEIEPATFPISETRGKDSPAVYGHIRRVIKSGEMLRFSTTRHLQKAGKQRACVQMVVTNIIPKNGKGYSKKIQLNKLTTIPFAVDITANCVEVDMTVPQEVMVEETVMCGRQTVVMLPILNRSPTAVAVVVENFIHDLPQSEKDFRLKFPRRPTIVSGNTNTHIKLSLTAKCHGQERVARFACREVETGVGFIVSARFVVQVPQLKFDPYVQVGGVLVSEERTALFKLGNPSCLVAPWRIIPLLLKTEKCVTFIPSEGTLRPGKSILIKVTVRSDEPVELMSKCLLEVDHVRTRPLWIMASVQYPSLSITPLHVAFDSIYLGLDCSIEFAVTNPSLFPVTFSWGHVKDCQHLHVEHCSALLIHKLEKRKIVINFTATALGDFRDGSLPFFLNGKSFATAVLSGQILGPSLKVFYHTGNSFAVVSPSSPVIPYPHLMELCKEVELSFSLTNDSPVPARFTALVEEFPENWAPTDKVSDQMRVAELYHELNLPPKFHPVKIALSTASGTIRQNERVSITLRIVGSMWGQFRDYLCLKFDHGQDYRIPISFYIMSSPVRFLQNMSGPSEIPLIRFKAHTVGSLPEYRRLTVQNILPYDLEVDWITAMQSEEKKHHFGVEVDLQKLPHLINTEMLTIGVPSISGVPCDKLFSVYPKRLVVLASSTAVVTVKFEPPAAMSEVTEFDGLLIGQARVKDRIAKGLEEPWLNGSYAPAVQMRLRAQLLSFGLSVSTSREPSLSVAAPDVLSRIDGDPLFRLSPLSLVNRASAVMQFGLSVPFPFAVRSVVCKDVTGQQMMEMDTEEGMYSLLPQKFAEVKLSFDMSASQFATVIRKHIDCNSYQNLDIRSELGIWNASVETPMFVALHATIILPLVKVSRTEIDFSVSKIQQPYEQVFYLSNSIRSACPWKLHFDESTSVFTLSEMEGVLPASTDMKDITHAITVTYTPMSLGSHNIVVICTGLLDAEITRINLSGSAVLDFGKSHVPLV